MSKKISTLKGTPSKDASSQENTRKCTNIYFSGWHSCSVQYLCKRSLQKFMNSFCFEFELRLGSAAMSVSSVPVRLAHDVMYIRTLFITYQPHNARRGGTLSTSFCFSAALARRFLRGERVDLNRLENSREPLSLSLYLPPLSPSLSPSLSLSIYLS